MTILRAAVLSTLMLAAAVPAATTPRSTSLARFDNGYAQCEKLDPAMRGHRDEVYASLYKLRLDDDLRKLLEQTRNSAPYKSERRRAQQTLSRSAGASDVQQRLEQQCLALKREIKPRAPAASATR